MDTIYLKQPIFLLLPILLSLFQIIIYFLSRNDVVSPFVNKMLTYVCVAAHAAAISLILLLGGTLYDALILVLISALLSLLLSPEPDKSDKGEEKN